MQDDFTIATLALEAPVRRYRINAVLRKKTELEAPTEACLKALSVAERLSEAVLTRYLGLAQEEFDMVASELLGQALVRRSGPDLMLTQRGREELNPNAEGQKREEATATLIFEDTAFAEAPRNRSRSWMRRMTSNDLRDDGRGEAAAAFREGFIGWRARQGGSRLGDTLARVTNVSPLGRGTAAILAPVTLAPASDAAFIDVSRIGLGDLTSAERREACAERFREAVETSSAPQDGAAALEWIRREIGQVPGAPLLDPVGWARRARLGEVESPAGAFLISESAPSLISKGKLVPEIECQLEGESRRIGEVQSDVFLWSPPEAESWRLDADIEVATAYLLRSAREQNEDDTGLVAGLFRCRKGEERDVERLWQLESGRGPFGAALLVSSPRSESSLLAPGVGETLPQALELVVRPGMWALAIAHLATDRSPIPIPVGILSIEPEAVSRVTVALKDKVHEAVAQDWRGPGGRDQVAQIAQRVSRQLVTAL